MPPNDRRNSRTSSTAVLWPFVVTFFVRRVVVLGPPFAEDGEEVEHFFRRLLQVGRLALIEPPGQTQVLLDGEAREGPFAAGNLDDPSRRDLVRGRVRGVASVEDDRARVGLDESG